MTLNLNTRANESAGQPVNGLASFLDDLVERHSRPEQIGRDPLCFPRRHREPADQEVAALLAACLAWGRVEQIHRVLERLLTRLGDRPASALRGLGRRRAAGMTEGIIHRVATSADLAAALLRVGETLREHGSLRALFLRGHRTDDETTLPALTEFSAALLGHAGGETRGLKHFFPRPKLGSACKRWMLFLRWVVRPDDGVDLGLWPEVSPAQLIIPLDTHIHRIARNLRLTRRSDNSIRTALEITAALRRWRPEDPVGCDFALSRLGIHQICPTRVDPAICAGCGLRSVCRHGEELA
jgi:uncharacterized protein (TIGR02757 family)